MIQISLTLRESAVRSVQSSPRSFNSAIRPAIFSVARIADAAVLTTQLVVAPVGVATALLDHQNPQNLLVSTQPTPDAKRPDPELLVWNAS